MLRGRLGPAASRRGGAPILQSEIIARVFDGFREGRDEDVEKVRGWIRGVVLGGNWRFRDADSVQQEALLALLQLARSGRVREPGGFQKLVYTVAKNTCVDTYHGERRRGEREVDEDLPDERPSSSDPEETVSRREKLDLLVYIFQRLPAACRQLWNWVYREERPAAEVAELLGISVGNARVRVHRCLEKARRIREEAESWPAGGTRRT